MSSSVKLTLLQNLLLQFFILPPSFFFFYFTNSNLHFFSRGLYINICGVTCKCKKSPHHHNILPFRETVLNDYSCSNTTYVLSNGLFIKS